MSSNAQTYESGMQAGGAAGAAASAREGFNYVFGLINLAVVFCLVWLLWYVFMHADGVMKLYTPMYGFALVVDIHVVVDGGITVRRGHAIAHEVKEALCKSDLKIADVLVHIEPHD